MAGFADPPAAMPSLRHSSFASLVSLTTACALGLLISACGGGGSGNGALPLALVPAAPATPDTPDTGAGSPTPNTPSTPSDTGSPTPPDDPDTGTASPYLSAQAGDVLAVKIRELHPTQPAVGYDQIYYHLGRKQPDPARYTPTAAGYQGDVADDNYSRYMYRTDRKRIDDYCADNGRGGVDDSTYVPLTARLADASTFACTEPAPTRDSAAAQGLKTVVVGPKGTLYLTDGHHTMTALHDLPDGGPELTVWVRVAANLGDAPDTDTFWSQMQANNYAWLKDASQNPITPDQLPAEVGLAHMQDDPYRSLVYFTRDLGYSNANVSEFAEFYWATGLRNRGFDLAPYSHDDLARARIQIDGGAAVPRPGDSTTSYVAAVRDAALRMVALADTDVVDGGRTAAELGRLPTPTSAGTWNDLMEDDIWRADVNSSGIYRSAGKAWYAQRYRLCGAASAAPACWQQSN